MDTNWDKYYKKYVVHTIGDVDGVGVFVGNMFITAGHVIENENLFVYLDGVGYKLEKNSAKVFFVHDKKRATTEVYDIAVFDFEGINSPLTLSDQMPEVGKELVSIIIERLSKSSAGTATSIFNSSNKTFDLTKCNGIVMGLSDNFFKCKMSSILREGSSGSPIFDGDKVVGILCGHLDEDELSVILFQSASSIMGHITRET